MAGFYSSTADDLRSFVIPVVTMVATFTTYVGPWAVCGKGYANMRCRLSSWVVCSRLRVSSRPWPVCFVWPEFLDVRLTSATVLDVLRDQLHMIFNLMPMIIQGSSPFVAHTVHNADSSIPTQPRSPSTVCPSS